MKNKQPYISLNLMIQTEYCSGLTLKKFIKNRQSKIDRKQNYQIFSQIVDGVLTIHQANIIHRDLKPDNIFLDKHNNVKIGDFGLARGEFDLVVQQEPQNTPRGLEFSTCAGTPQYFSPE